MACSSSSSSSSASSTSGGTGATLTAVTSWTYQLQNIDVSALGNSAFDLAVVDYSADGDDATAFSEAQVTQMKGSGDSSKLLLAYMSIGEAEDYRYYFDASASYIDTENPLWPGNFKVHYWESDWQDVIDTYIDRLIAAGFDGAYLDIIDAYEYYGPGGDSGLDRATAAEDMVNFVIHIADYARAQDSDFLVFPQNGAGILSDSGMSDEYLDVIDGIGAEDTFYYGDEDENNALDVQDGVITNLDKFTAAGKTVLSVDYLTDSDKIDDFYDRAEDKGYIPYATVRDLDELTVNEGHAL